MEAAPENPEMGDPIPGSTSRQHLPGSSCWDAWGVGCGVHTLGNICCSKAQGWLCRDSASSVLQVQQDPPDLSGISSSSSASLLHPQLHLRPLLPAPLPGDGTVPRITITVNKSY